MARELTWQHDDNRDNGGLGVAKDTNTFVAWYVYAFLTGRIGGATLGLWTLAGSSDGVTAGLDTTERLGATYDATKWTRATASGTAHSWFTLCAPYTDGGQPVYLTCSYIGDNDNCVTWDFSSGAISGGSITAVPTMAGRWGGTFGGSTYVVTRQLTDGSGATIGHRLYGSLASNGAFHVHGSKNASGRYSWSLFIHLVTDRLHTPTIDPVLGRTTAPWGFVVYSPSGNHFAKPGDSTSAAAGAGGINVYGLSSSDGATTVAWNPRTSSATLTELRAGIMAPCFLGTGGSAPISPTEASAKSLAVSNGDAQVLSDGSRINMPAFVFAGAVDANARTAAFHGRAPDVLLVHNSLAHGDVFPAFGTVEYAVCGTLALPAGAVPLL